MMKRGDYMNKKLGMFAIGYLLAIIVVYIIPVLIIYPNVISTIENNYEQISSLVDLEEDASEKTVLVSTLKDQVNIRNYIIAYYALTIFIVLILVGLLCIKDKEKLGLLGKGILIGDFVGAAGFIATVVFSSSYFVL